MTVHVCLQRRGTSKPLVANLALVLLLRVRRNLGAELGHHRLRRRRSTSRQKVWRTRKGSWRQIIVGFGSRAVIGHGRINRSYRGAVVRVTCTRGSRRSGGMGGWESVRISGTSGAARAVDVARRQVLAQRNHTTAGIQRVTKSRSWRSMWLTDASVTEVAN